MSIETDTGYILDAALYRCGILRKEGESDAELRKRACEHRTDPQPCTDAELDAVAADYAETMRARGFTIGSADEVAIRRAAAIQDTWRLAFKRVLG
jgi:hypothetical protein